MVSYCWEKNVLHILDNGKITDIVFPDITLPKSEYDTPVVSCNKRYVAVPDGRQIYVYDNQNDKVTAFPEKLENSVYEVRFDSLDRIYYIEGNRIGRWDLSTQKTVLLYNMGRAVHGPESLGVSPDGRYISFCKYCSSSDYLFVLDTLTGECRDLKFSIYHYVWVDESHIAWSKYGGLKILDVRTGKSKTILKDYLTVIKKCRKEDSPWLEPFRTLSDVSTNIDLLGHKNGQLYFSLWVYKYFDPNMNEASIHHKGIWKVNTAGSDLAFCYVIPDEFMKAIYKGFMANGSIYWRTGESLNLFDGAKFQKIIGQYMGLPIAEK